jgi:tetratricopeptide (TPR) repeat protein
MNDTLHLFDELLEHDSGSKIFFPLARLYRRQGHTQRAIEIVRKGIEHHPDYLEAQLYLIELLCEVGDDAAAESKAQSVFVKLMSYEKFWLCLRAHYAKSQQPNLALASFLVERSALGEDVDVMKLLNFGIAHYSEMMTSSTAISEPEKDLDAEEVAQFCINSGIKTKTMAKLLAAQGEYEQAIKIYDELIEAAGSEAERAELLDLRTAAYAELGTAPDPEAEKHNKLFRVLNSLADRLEHKTGSGPAGDGLSSSGKSA